MGLFEMFKERKNSALVEKINAKCFFNTVEKQLSPHNIVIDLEITSN